MNTLYRLIMTDDHGITYTINGSEEVLRAAYNELKEAMSGVYDGGVMVEINGMTDSADRAEHTLLVKASSIIALSITKMY